MTITTKRFLVVFSVGLIFVLYFILDNSSYFPLPESPYVMYLESEPNGGVFVQFMHPDNIRYTPKIPVSLKFKGRQRIRLRQDLMVIPGCFIDFMDALPPPGRVRVKIGNSMIDIMEEKYYVDEIYHKWKPSD